MKELVGSEFAVGTYTRYETTLKHVKAFLLYQFKTEDILLKKLNLSFITDFEFYMRKERGCNNNSAIKYIKNVRKVINLAIKQNWLVTDPFKSFDGKVKQVKTTFLTQEELDTLENKEFAVKRLEEIRDVFLFCCYTGYAYVDVSQLTQDDVITKLDGSAWIYHERQKTGVNQNVPLLPRALEIVKKYCDHPQCKAENRLLPVKSNQKMNAYLKEIQTLCSISKNLTTHLARHTFATTVTLSNGVPLETVSKLLGHSEIKMTQHYAKVIEKKLGDDMSVLREKLQIEKDKKEAG